MQSRLTAAADQQTGATRLDLESAPGERNVQRLPITALACLQKGGTYVLADPAQKCKNYGWPLVSFGVNNNGVPIPNPDTRPDLAKPVLYWVPDIAPGNMVFYKGAMFPQWDGNGSVLIGGLSSQSLSRIVVTGGMARSAERWNVGRRIRDVAVGPNGAVWMLEDANPGGLFRVTPPK